MKTKIGIIALVIALVIELSILIIFGINGDGMLSSINADVNITSNSLEDSNGRLAGLKVSDAIRNQVESAGNQMAELQNSKFKGEDADEAYKQLEEYYQKVTLLENYYYGENFNAINIYLANSYIPGQIEDDAYMIFYIEDSDTKELMGLWLAEYDLESKQIIENVENVYTVKGLNSLPVMEMEDSISTDISVIGGLIEPHDARRVEVNDGWE